MTKQISPKYGSENPRTFDPSKDDLSVVETFGGPKVRDVPIHLEMMGGLTAPYSIDVLVAAFNSALPKPPSPWGSKGAVGRRVDMIMVTYIFHARGRDLRHVSHPSNHCKMRCG